MRRASDIRSGEQKMRQEEIKRHLELKARKKTANKTLDKIFCHTNGVISPTSLPAILKNCGRFVAQVAVERIEENKDALPREDVKLLADFKRLL